MKETDAGRRRREGRRLGHLEKAEKMKKKEKENVRNEVFKRKEGTEAMVEEVTIGKMTRGRKGMGALRILSQKALS